MDEEQKQSDFLKRVFWGPFSLIGMSVAVAAFLIDQGHKFYMVEIYRLGDKGRVKLLPFFDLVLSWNKGVSYGMFQQTSWLGALGLSLFALIAVIGLVVYLAHVENRLAAISLGLIISGALGNGLDRLHWPGVADYFSFHVGSFEWYIFNIADVAIVVGVVGLIYEALFMSPKNVSKSP